MKPLDSNVKRSLKAREVFQKAFIQAMAFSFLAVVVVLIGTLAMLSWLGADYSASELVMPIIVGGGSTLPLFGAQLRAQNALRKAGLLREETETVARTATTFAGETLQVRESTMGARLGLAAFFLLLIGGCWWLYRDQTSSLLVQISMIGAALLFFGFAVQILVNSGRPELRMDERGITSCQSLVFSHLVPWERIATLQCKRAWGLPPDYLFDKKPTETITLQDARGRAILTLHAGSVGGSVASVWTDAPNASLRDGVPKVPVNAQKQRFIAELRRRLTGENATPDAEAHDG